MPTGRGARLIQRAPSGWLIASNPVRELCALGDCCAADPAVTNFFHLWPFARSHGELGFHEAVTEKQ